MSEQEAKQALQSLFDQTQPMQKVRRGLLGDSNGTVMVATRPGWAYIRYHAPSTTLSIVRYLIPEQLSDGTPVVVGKRHPGDAYEQVLGVDWAMYAWAPTDSTVNQHATPAIDLSDLSPGKVVPTDPVSLSVDVRAFLYVNGDNAVEYGGGAIDLTANVPGIAGHRYVLVYMDLSTDSLAAENGAIVALGVNAVAPAVPENGLPLGIVDLEQAQATITGDDIWQYKAMYDSVGAAMALALLSDYAQGYIIRGGAADWEAYDANDDAQILVGDGTDINSVPVTGDLTLDNAGATVVTALQGNDVQDHAPLDGEVLVWSAGNSRWEPGHAPPIEPIYVRASQMWPSTTNGCAALAQTELGTNDVDIQTLDFDPGADEFAQFSLWMPEEWNAGTITYQVVWTAAAGTLTDEVEWNLQGRAYADSDALDQAWGASVEVADALITLDDLHETAESGAVTLAGTPVAGEWCMFRVWRDGVNDTLNDGDGKLLGIKLFYTKA